MGLSDSLRSFANVLEKVGEGLAVISHLTKNTSDDKAADLLKLVSQGLDDVLNDLGVKVDPQVVQAHIKALRDHIAATDAIIDQAIAEKFDKG
jgi:hypothetical protein